MQLLEQNIHEFSDKLFIQISQMSEDSSTIKGGRTKFKIIFLGDQSVGKSSIIEKYIKDKFEEGLNPTIGIDFHIKNVTRNGKHFRIQLWDTAGQQRFRSLIPNYMKDANCAVMVYDITRKSSLDNIKIWNNMFQEHQNPDAIKVVVGNKTDLQDEREVSKKEAELQASTYKCKNFEVSAKNGKKLDQLFNCIVDMIVDISENGRKLPVINQKIEKQQAQNSHPSKQHVPTEKFSLKPEPIPKKTNKKKGCCKDT